MSDAKNNKSFGLGLTAINDVLKRIDYTFDDIFFSPTNFFTI